LLLAATGCGGSDANPAGSGHAGSGGLSAGGSAGQPSAGQGGASGAPSSAGSGGVGGEPLTDVGPQQKSGKLDVLFVIDNSANMAQKHAILAASLPSFVDRVLKMAPDVHLGVITTSIGNHGGTICTPGTGSTSLHVDDQAELLPSKREGLTSYMDTGYLSFDATGKMGISDGAMVSAQLQTMIGAVGEDGCGYEAPLEAMYRFLVDPAPPLGIAMTAGSSMSTGVNAELLKQRESFLRPDSAVAIVILSDENDCSIMDRSVGWLVAQATTRMPLATTVCDKDPNDPCCRSCATRDTMMVAGCSPVSQDANCMMPAQTTSYAAWDAAHDSLNLRCFDQKRRFGFDLLNPLSRYTAALTNPRITADDGTAVDNPLLAARAGAGPRSATLISVSVIVGVPWQDLATDASLSSTTELSYLKPAELVSKARWPMLVGSPQGNQPPGDPFMIESIAPRSGANPITKAPIVPATSLNPTESPINGHEQNVPNNDDLQYACTFPLQMPIVCQSVDACACSPESGGDTTLLVQRNSPVCQPPAGGPASSTEYFGRGYPGTRELEFARALGDRATPASICPAQLTAPAGANFGYVPALNALADRIAVTLK
jgi:hypothetical protein